MKSSFVTVCFLICVSAYLVTSNMTVQQESQDLVLTNINYNMARGRGFISGWYKGMYKNQKYQVKKLCLGNETVNDMYYLYKTIYQEIELDPTMSLARAEEVWYLFFGYCDFDNALYDLAKWCNNMNCTLPYIGTSFLKKTMQVTTVANDMIELFATEPPAINDTSAVFTYYERLAIDFGKLTRYAIDFDPTLINSL